MQGVGKIQMVKHCERLVADLPAGTRTKANLEAVVSKFGGYEVHNKAFATPTASTLGEVAADASTLGEVAAGDPFSEVRPADTAQGRGGDAGLPLRLVRRRP